MPQLGLKIEAAFAGGSLRNWNQLLWLLQCARERGEGWQPVVDVVDPVEDELNFLDSKGHCFSIPIPHAGLDSEEHREALIQAIIGRLPGGALVEPTLRQMMPQVGEDVVAASRRWWHAELGIASIRGSNSDLSDEENEVHWLNPSSMPELVWVGPRQQRAMTELRIEAADAIGGEDHLKELLLHRKPSDIPLLIQELDQSIQAGMTPLRKSVQEEAPTLYGSFARLKRATHRAMKEFQKSSERHFRNNKGIRGNRLRLLGQALRPQGAQQQDGLSLISAMALFHLQPARVVEQFDLFHGAKEQDTVLVNCETGIRSLISLSC